MLNAIQKLASKSCPVDSEHDIDDTIRWLELTLPKTVRLLMDTDDLDMPIFMLPLAQMRLAQALYSDEQSSVTAGETMGRLSEKLGVRQNALTQAADRLVNHLLAERTSDPADRRIVRLRLTQTGIEWVEQRRVRRAIRLRKVYSALSLKDRKYFVDAVRTLESAVEKVD